MKRLLTTKHLLPISSPAIKNGAIVLDDQTVIAIGDYSTIKADYPDLPVIDYSDYIILPGFVNCHTHLELTALAGKFQPSDSFTGWIKQMVRLKPSLTEKEMVKGIDEGIKMLWESGVIAVGDICSEHVTYDRLIKSPLRGVQFFEFLALQYDDVENRMKHLIDSLPNRKNKRIDVAISPHSTYTLCQKAFEMISIFIKESGYHSAIHVGESDEERHFFESRTGELFKFIHGYVPVSEKIKGTTPLTYLDKNDFLTNEAMMIHLNILLKEEIDILQKKNLSVIHCPLSHDYFNHPEFQMKLLVDNQINVALGSDSLASNKTLNFFEELRAVKRKYPFLSPEKIIEMGTLSGAKALKLPEGIGEIKPGCFYDLIGISVFGRADDPCETVIGNQSSIINIRNN